MFLFTSESGDEITVCQVDETMGSGKWDRRLIFEVSTHKQTRYLELESSHCEYYGHYHSSYLQEVIPREVITYEYDPVK